MNKTHRVGITTTIPIEVLYSTGAVPVDLNNVFITDPDRGHFALEAERSGLPRTVCGWNKGVLTAALTAGVRRVVEVVQGDCSTSEAVGRILAKHGVEVIPFAYPFDADPVALAEEMGRLADRFGVTLAQAEQTWAHLQPIRRDLAELDRLTWEDGVVTGFENHLYLVSGSDLNSDPETFHRNLAELLARVRHRTSFREEVRLGYIGVPSMLDNLYHRVEEMGGRVVFNELQRQFSMSEPAPTLVEQYRRYTYPYSVFGRVADIRREIQRRGIQGLLHYVQTFCFHHVEDQIFRKELALPILTLEADHPGLLSPRDETRLENFLRTLRGGRPAAAVAVSTDRVRLGLDLGSRWVKVVVCRAQEVLAKEKFDTMEFYRTFFQRQGGAPLFQEDRLAELMRGAADLPAAAGGVECRTTGYGRYLVKTGLSETVPELQAQVNGVLSQLGLLDFTLLDIGGQDTKVVLVRDGRMVDFAMNDRCAAGGGRYLENMARLLGITPEELGLYFHEPVPLSATCATFGESEVVGLIVEGVPEEAICAGINRTVFLRVRPDLERFPSETLVISGGVARNQAILHFLKTETAFARVITPPDPDFNGALGTLYPELQLKPGNGS